MKVIVMGCGLVGEQVSRLLTSAGHEVTVIDADPSALARLGSDFPGQKILGVGFDRDILNRAGIRQADAFVATSPSDNANIVAARIARNIYHVPKVITRLYDPHRAEIYRRLGLVTISTTNWGAERINELLTHANLDPVISFGRGDVALVAVEISSNLEGRQVKQLNIPGELIVVSITRDGEAFIPTLGAEFHLSDVVHLCVQATAMDRLESLLEL
ncbi:MAG: TrkA family potassium uptake protein [Chloroflexi bacterium]|nr:TrkA family potassium uptake protein [Chloroflexota bacterium]